MNADRPLIGVFLMVGFAALAPLMDAFAKLASEAIPIGQIVATRFCIQALLLTPIAVTLGTLHWPSRGDLVLHVARAALILSATAAFFAAISVMPIADAISIFFVEPFILTLLGALLLGEKVGWRRMLACAIGFAGALLVIRPSFSAFGPVAMLPLLTAVAFALYMILTRRMARSLHPVALQAWTALAAAALILPVLALFNNTGIPVLDVVMPNGQFWGYLLGVGLVASVTHLLLSGALRFAPAATIAPLQYCEIVAATGLGYLLFADFPDALTFLGIAIIIGSGLFVIMRERQISRPLPPP